MSETQQLIDLMREQMEKLDNKTEQLLQMNQENETLRRDLQTATDNRSGSGTQTKKPDRPGITPELTDNDWALFLDSWARYKSMCRLTLEVDIRNELRAYCDPAINKMLFELVGATTLNALPEMELLERMRKVAVRGVHKEVHRQRFFRITQAEGESLNRFVARLKAQAALCDFRITCTPTESHSYSEEMVAHQMISGLANPGQQ